MHIPRNQRSLDVRGTGPGQTHPAATRRKEEACPPTTK